MKWQNHFTIPGYGDTVFQTDSKSKKEFAEAELIIEVPSSRWGLPTKHTQEGHEPISIASNLGYTILQSQGWLVAFSKRT
ncbi:MAG: hypothetical protein K6G31_04670 [Paludibacteraceae bacterium]|nr:hypothetical protein [Paludibacteraceae bacterium]